MCFVWFKTEAFSEYAELFGLGDYLLVYEYREKRRLSPSMTYPDFLVAFHNSFFVRLINCQYCIATWTILIASSTPFIFFSNYAAFVILSSVSEILLKKSNE